MPIYNTRLPDGTIVTYDAPSELAASELAPLVDEFVRTTHAPRLERDLLSPAQLESSQPAPAQGVVPQTQLDVLSAPSLSATSAGVWVPGAPDIDPSRLPAWLAAIEQLPVLPPELRSEPTKLEPELRPVSEPGLLTELWRERKKSLFQEDIDYVLNTFPTVEERVEYILSRARGAPGIDKWWRAVFMPGPAGMDEQFGLLLRLMPRRVVESKRFQDALRGVIGAHTGALELVAGVAAYTTSPEGLAFLPTFQFLKSASMAKLPLGIKAAAQAGKLGIAADWMYHMGKGTGEAAAAMYEAYKRGDWGEYARNMTLMLGQAAGFALLGKEELTPVRRLAYPQLYKVIKAHNDAAARDAAVLHSLLLARARGLNSSTVERALQRKPELITDLPPNDPVVQKLRDALDEHVAPVRVRLEHKPPPTEPTGRIARYDPATNEIIVESWVIERLTPQELRSLLTEEFIHAAQRQLMALNQLEMSRLGEAVYAAMSVPQRAAFKKLIGRDAPPAEFGLEYLRYLIQRGTNGKPLELARSSMLERWRAEFWDTINSALLTLQELQSGLPDHPLLPYIRLTLDTFQHARNLYYSPELAASLTKQAAELFGVQPSPAAEPAPKPPARLQLPPGRTPLLLAAQNPRPRLEQALNEVKDGLAKSEQLELPLEPIRTAQETVRAGLEHQPQDVQIAASLTSVIGDRLELLHPRNLNRLIDAVTQDLAKRGITIDRAAVAQAIADEIAHNAAFARFNAAGELVRALDEGAFKTNPARIYEIIRRVAHDLGISPDELPGALAQLEQHIGLHLLYADEATLLNIARQLRVKAPEKIGAPPQITIYPPIRAELMRLFDDALRQMTAPQLEQLARELGATGKLPTDARALFDIARERLAQYATPEQLWDAAVSLGLVEEFTSRAIASGRVFPAKNEAPIDAARRVLLEQGAVPEPTKVSPVRASVVARILDAIERKLPSLLEQQTLIHETIRTAPEQAVERIVEFPPTKSPVFRRGEWTEVERPLTSRQISHRLDTEFGSTRVIPSPRKDVSNAVLVGVRRTGPNAGEAFLCAVCRRKGPGGRTYYAVASPAATRAGTRLVGLDTFYRNYDIKAAYQTRLPFRGAIRLGTVEQWTEWHSRLVNKLREPELSATVPTKEQAAPVEAKPGPGAPDPIRLDPAVLDAVAEHAKAPEPLTPAEIVEDAHLRALDNALAQLAVTPPERILDAIQAAPRDAKIAIAALMEQLGVSTTPAEMHKLVQVLAEARNRGEFNTAYMELLNGARQYPSATNDQLLFGTYYGNMRKFLKRAPHPRRAAYLYESLLRSIDNFFGYQIEPAISYIERNGAEYAKEWATRMRQIRDRAQELYNAEFLNKYEDELLAVGGATKIGPVRVPAPGLFKQGQELLKLEHVLDSEGVTVLYRRLVRLAEDGQVPNEYMAAFDKVNRAIPGLGGWPAGAARGEFARLLTPAGWDIIMSPNTPKWRAWALSIARLNRVDPAIVMSDLIGLYERARALRDMPTAETYVTVLETFLDFERKWKYVPSHIKYRGLTEELYYTYPEQYLRLAALRAAYTRAFREVYPRTPEGIDALARDVARVETELRPGAERGLVGQVVRLAQGYTPDPGVPLFGIVHAGSATARAVHWFETSFIRLMSALALTRQLQTQLPETFTGATYGLIPIKYVLGAWRDLVRPGGLDALRFTSAISRETLSFLIDTAKPVSGTVRTTAEFLSYLFSERFFNEIQEILAAASMRRWAQAIRAGTASKRERVAFRQLAREMKFSEPEINRALAGDAQVLDRVIGRFPEYSTSGNAHPLDLSPLATQRVFRTLFRFYRYPMTRLRQGWELMHSLARALESGDRAEIRAAFVRAAKWMTFMGLQGFIQSVLANLIFESDLEGFKHQTISDPAKTLFEIFLGAVGGPYYWILMSARDAGLRGTLATIGDEAMAMMFPIAVTTDVFRAFVYPSGRYRDKTFQDRARLFCEYRVPALRPIRNIAAYTGLAQYDVKTEAAIRRATRWLVQRRGRAYIETKIEPETDRAEWNRKIRQYINAALLRLHRGDWDGVAENLRNAYAASVVTGFDVAQSLRARRVLPRDLSIDELAELERAIGPENVQRVMAYDRFLEVLATDGTAVYSLIEQREQERRMRERE